MKNILILLFLRIKHNADFHFMKIKGGKTMYCKEKKIFENRNGKIIRIEDYFGNFRYVLLDRNGDYIRDIPSVYAVENMPELFPTLAKN